MAKKKPRLDLFDEAFQKGRLYSWSPIYRPTPEELEEERRRQEEERLRLEAERLQLEQETSLIEKLADRLLAQRLSEQQYVSAYPGAYPGQTATPPVPKYPVVAKDFAEYAGKYDKPEQGLLERLEEAFTITGEDAAKKPGAWDTARNVLGAMGATTMLPIYQLAKYLATGVEKLGEITRITPLDKLGETAVASLEKQLLNDETFLALASEQMQKGNWLQKFLYRGAPSIPSVLMTGMAGGALAQNLGAAMGAAAGTMSSAGQAIPAGYKAVADATPLAQALATKLVSMAPFGLHAAGSYAREAEREGADVPAQLSYAISSAIFEILTESPIFSRWAETIGRVGGDLLMRRGTESLLKKWGVAGLRVLTDALAEAGQEAIVGPLAGVAKKTFVNKDMPWLGEGGVVDFTQMPEDAFGGFAMSILLTAFSLPVSALSKRMATKALNDIEKGRPITLNEIVEINKQLTKDLEKYEEQIKKYTTSGKGTLRYGQQPGAEGPIKTVQDQLSKEGVEKRSEPKYESQQAEEFRGVQPPVETKVPGERPGAPEAEQKAVQQPARATGEPVKTESLKPGDIVYFKGSPVEFLGVDKDKVMVRGRTGLEYRLSKRDFERNYTAGLPAELQVEPSVRAAQETKLEEGAKAAAQQAKGETAEPRNESEKTKTTGQTIANPDDIPYKRAYDAYYAVSFDPEKNAKLVQEEYVQHMESVYNELSKHAQTDEQKALLDSEFERYRQKYIEKTLAWLDAKSRTMSVMITGPANFPVERNQKAMEVVRQRLNDLLEFDKKAQAAIKKKLDAAKTPEQVSSESGEEPIAQYDGARIIRNHDIDRVQIFMDAKPSQDVINALKAEGWRWSPSNRAWQRKGTPAAESSAKRIVGEYYSVKPAQEKTEKHTPPERPSNHMLMTVKALRDQAKALDRQIEAKRNPAIAQQNKTARRARIVAQLAAEANQLERLQTTINRIADAMEDGSLAPVLSQIKKKTQVETLLAVSRRENPSIFWEHPETLKRLLEEAKGMNGITDIRPLVERVIRNGGRSNSEKEVKAISRLVNILNNAGKLDYAGNRLKESVTEANRLLEMGIVDSDSLREAIKAIKPYVEEKPKEKTKEQLIREKEAALIGTKIPGYFPTPRTLAQNLVYRADIKPGMKVLEPSAGKGNIADQVPKEADLSVIEINSTLRDLLETKGYNVVDRDFLEHTGEYDRIVMNPPFENGQDIDHVRHAYDLLKPGGKLVSIMSEGPFFRSDKKATEFREWFEEVGGTSEKLPAGSFTGPEAERQTGVNARIVEIEKDKPQEVSTGKSPDSSSITADKPKEIFQAFPPVKEVQVNIENGELSIPEEWIDSVTTNADQDSGISYAELWKDLSSEVKNALARIKSPEITTEIHRWDGETVQVKGEAVTPGMVIEKDEDGKFVLWHINSGKYVAKYRNRESAILCAKVLAQHGDMSVLDEAGIVQLVRENKLQKFLNQVALRDANNLFFPYDGMELVLGYKTAEKIYKNMVVGGEKVFPYNKETAEAILQVKPKVSSILDLVTKKVWRTPNERFFNDKNSPVGHLVGSELLLFINDEFKISDKKLAETAASQAKRKIRVIDDVGNDAMIKEWFKTPISAKELSDPKWIDKDFVIFEVECASDKEKYISISVPVYDYLTRKGYEFYYEANGREIIKIVKGDKVVGVVGPARVEKDVIKENYLESLPPPPPKKEDYLTVVRLKQTEPARPAEAKLQEQPRPVEGETKKSVEEELAERTNQYLKAAGPPLKIVSYQVPHGKGEVTYKDPKLEEAFIAGHGVPQKSIMHSIQEHFVEFKNKLTRDFEHLPNEPRFEEARTALHRLLKQVGVCNTRAKHIVRGILYRLDRKQLGLYERAVVLYDIAEELKRDNPSVPAVFTKDKVEAELEHINRLVDNDPIVKEALALRKKAMNDLVEEYVQAMKSIGLDVEDRFTRENYFHHQVLEYANLHGVFNRKKVRTPTGSGFLKQREGYKGLYNTNYLQVETQVISEMLHAIEIARAIQKIDQHYNIVEQLKRKAFQINEEKMMEYFREIIRQSDDYDPKTLEEDAGKLFRRTLNWKQADAINRLSALAAQGELPVGENGEFKDIVSELAVDPEGINFKRLLAYANYLVKTDQETGKAEAAQLFRGINDKRKAMQEILGKEFVTWENLIPEGYTEWQPREGSLMFLTESIPAQLAEKLRQGMLESLEITEKDLRKVLVVGGPRARFVIPEEVALTLDNLQRPAPKSWFYKGVKAITKAWKRFRIGNPKTNVKYQFRNVSSDAEWTALGNPRAFKRVPGVVKELYNVIFKDYAPTGELKEFFMRGGFEAGELGQEIGNIDQLKMFKHLVEKKGTVAEVPLKVWQTYWKVVNVSNNFREAILRYANYLEYLDQMKKNNGVPLNWGASDEKTVMALSDIRDRAYLMANQLVGAYDRVWVITQEASDTALPFFRFQEVNFKRYSQWIKNQARDGRVATAVGKHFLGKLAKSPRLAYNVGKLILKAIGLTSILAAWNHLFFPDEEEDLPADVRSSPHLIFGRDKQGNVLYLSRLGALEDFIEWFGVDEPYGLVQDFLNGRKTLKEIALDMAKGPVNKLTQALNPLFKVPAEIATGQTFFPDVFEPRRIRDKWLYLAQQLELEEEYRALAKLPRREGYLASWKRALFNVAAPGESAYWEIIDLKHKFLKSKTGGSSYTITDTKRSNALYNMKLALRYGDKEAYEHYMAEYFNAGGTRAGMSRSLASLDPLYGLGKYQKEFRRSLNKEEQVKLQKAIEFYRNMLR